MSRFGEQCPVVDRSRECWDCASVYRVMVARLASGATYHAMNNAIMSMIGACECRDRDRYEEARARFFGMGRLGVALHGQRWM
jgi:hypothetical protein